MIDKITFLAKGGNGGNGCLSFKRARYAPKGGPDGGDGGAGGDVVIEGSSRLGDFSSLPRREIVKAQAGGPGEGKKRRGRDGKDEVVMVPLGTIVWEIDGETRVEKGNVLSPGKRVIIAKGGDRGRGNTRFATSINKVPLLAEEGEEGEEKEIEMEFRAVVDVALVGLPNSGKTSLFARLTQSRPNIAGHPFATTAPQLGMVNVGWERFVLVDLPSLFPGSHLGRGLGNDFLKHLWRAKVVALVVDSSSGNPLEDLRLLREEIGKYREENKGKSKQEIVVITKTDITGYKGSGEIKEYTDSLGLEGVPVSTENGDGIEPLSQRLHSLAAEKRDDLDDLIPSGEILRPKSIPAPTIRREGAVFVVSSPQAARLVRLPDLRQFQAQLQLRKELNKLGVVKALEKAGVSSGAQVRIGAVELVWE